MLKTKNKNKTKSYIEVFDKQIIIQKNYENENVTKKKTNKKQ